MKNSKLQKNIGKIARVIGPVVDVEFPEEGPRQHVEVAAPEPAAFPRHVNRGGDSRLAPRHEQHG